MGEMQDLDTKKLLRAKERIEKKVLEVSKIPVPYIFLLATAALLVSGIGAFFSVTGLAKLFSGAGVAVMFMASSLEFAKLVSAGFLHHNWKKIGILLRIYLSTAVFILMVITSLGIFGYLSNAYQKSSIELKNNEISIKSNVNELSLIRAEFARIQKTLDAVPERRVTKRIELQKEADPELRKLKAREFQIESEITNLARVKQSYQAEVGPLIYVAESFQVGVDQVAKYFILIFVSVFDPLAICLVFAVSWSMKEKGSQEATPDVPQKTGPEPKVTSIELSLEPPSPGEGKDKASNPRSPRRRRKRRRTRTVTTKST
jgi:hypothetical protein